MAFALGCLGIRRVAAHMIDEDGRRPGTVLRRVYTVVIFRSSVVAKAGIDADALALLIKITTQACCINRRLRSLQGPNVVGGVSASCSEIRIAEFDFAAYAAAAAAADDCV